MELPAEDEHGQSVILEEKIDENYEPTEEEILEYAGWLGMNLEKEKDLFWIASEGLKKPLPEDWKPCKSPEGHIYYFNFSTGESVWDHPCDDYYRKLYQDEKKKKEAAGGREPIAQSSSAVKPTAASTKVYQAPQKLSSLDSISGLKRKDDPFKRGSKLLGQSPTKDERPALLKSIPNLGTERKAELAQEEKTEELNRDKHLREEFASKLEAERKEWEESQQQKLEEEKEKIKAETHSKVEAYRKEVDGLYPKEKAAIDDKIEKYRENLEEIYSKEENVLRKLHQQKLSNLERDMNEAEERKKSEEEAQLMDRISALKEEHEEKVSSLKSENESVLKQLEVDLQLVSQTCSKKIEDMVKEKEDKEKAFAEEMSELEAEHLTRIESKKQELSETFEKKIKEIEESNELSVKNSQLVQSTFAEEQSKLEEIIKVRVEEEARKNESLLEEECAKLKLERDQRLKEENEKHQAILEEELTKLRDESNLKLKKARIDNEKYLSEELQTLRSTRAEQIAEDRADHEDKFNEIVADYDEKHRKAEEDAENSLKEKFKQLESKYFLEVEKREKDLKMEADLKVENIIRELERYESDCKQGTESKKKSIMAKLNQEMMDEIEAEKKKCLESISMELQEFKTQKRLELSKTVVEAPKSTNEPETESETSTDSGDESKESESIERFDAQTPPVAKTEELHESSPSLSNMDSVPTPSGSSHDLLNVFLKEQKQFLQQRQNALQKAREDWKAQAQALKERRDGGMPPSSSEDAALATAKYTLESQSRMLNEDTRNYRMLKKEVEKSVLSKSRMGGGNENNAMSESNDEEFASWMPTRSRKKEVLREKLREKSRFDNILQPAKMYNIPKSARRRSYEKGQQNSQHQNALHVLNGHSTWLTSFKGKLRSTLTKSNHDQKVAVAGALHRLRNTGANRELVIRINT